MITVTTVLPIAGTSECVSVSQKGVNEETISDGGTKSMSTVFFSVKGQRHKGKHQIKTQGRTFKICSFPTKRLFIMYFYFKVRMNEKKKFISK